MEGAEPGRAAWLILLIAVAMVVVLAGPVVREHCAANVERAGVELESRWTFVGWPLLLPATVDYSDRCIRNSPAREAAGALGIAASAEDQVRHKLDSESKENL